MIRHNYFHIITLVLSTFIFFSEPSFNKHRSIASIETVKEDVGTILDFKFYASNKTAHYSLEMLKHTFAADTKPNVFLQIFLSDNSQNLPKDVSFRLVPKVINNQYVFNIQYSKNGLTDYAAVVELQNFIKHFVKNHYKTKFNFFELYYNSLKNDPLSLKTFLELKKESFRVRMLYQTSEQLDPILNKDYNNLNSLIEKYDYLEKQERTKSIIAKRKRIEKFNFDQKKLNEKFHDLVSKNDRKGAADLLERILPWEIMRPLETKMFKDHLHYMKNPLPIEKRILLYRGIDNNNIFLDSNNPKNSKIYDALYSSQIYLFSHFLDRDDLSNKNFDEIRNTPFFLDPNIRPVNKFQKVTPITSYFYHHSNQSRRSLFLSTSQSIEIATSFGREKIVMLAIDPRMSYANFASSLAPEREYLVPFFIFPDEILSTVKYNYDTVKREYKARAHFAINDLLKNAYYRKFKNIPKNELEILLAKLEFNTRLNANKYFSKDNSLMGESFDNEMRKIIKFEIQQVNSPIKPKKSPDNCLDLVKAFFFPI